LNELLAALIPAWDADATLTAIPNPFLGLLPDGLTTYPNAEFAVIGQRNRLTFDRTIFQDVDLRITIRHTNYATLLTYARRLEDIFIKSQMGLGLNAACNSIVQLNRMDGAIPPCSVGADTVYFTAQTYRFATQRDLPAASQL
jgi:hypothetical protein